MSLEIAALLFIFHIVGAIITLIIFDKNGEFEYAAKHGDGIYFALPSDVVFHALVLWEFNLLLYIIITIDIYINNFFYKKYNDKGKL